MRSRVRSRASSFSSGRLATMLRKHSSRISLVQRARKRPVCASRMMRWRSEGIEDAGVEHRGDGHGAMDEGSPDLPRDHRTLALRPRLHRETTHRSYAKGPETQDLRRAVAVRSGNVSPVRPSEHRGSYTRSMAI